MQVLLSSFFVTYQVHIIIFLLVISSILFLNYLIANYKVELNLKKLHYNSEVLKINTSDWCTNEIIQRIKERIIKRLIDKKIIKKDDEAKVMGILAKTGNKKDKIVSPPLIIIPKQSGTTGTVSSTPVTATGTVSSTPVTQGTSIAKSSVIIPTKA